MAAREEEAAAAEDAMDGIAGRQAGRFRRRGLWMEVGRRLVWIAKRIRY
jgi:hypothetical protein